MSGPHPAAIDWAALTEHTPLPGVSGSVRLGRELSAAIFRLEPEAVVPVHQHPNEEFGQVLSGALELEVAGDRHVLHSGDGFLIPANVPHSAVATAEGCRLLECYAPARNPLVPQPGGASG